jgi:hydroxyethylthiazole kinase
MIDEAIVAKIIEYRKNLKDKHPLVNHVTNLVTMSEVANVTLHVGGSPVMGHSLPEVEEMTAISNSLCVNLGNLNSEWQASAILAGREANRKKIPVTLDPVGVGATRPRTNLIKEFAEKVEISAIRANQGEIGTLIGAKSSVKGVDSAGLQGDPIEIAKEAAKKLSAVVVMTGVEDIVTDGESVFITNNDTSWMQTLVGTGCMATAVVATYVGAAEKSSEYLTGALAAISLYGLAAELASQKAEGPGSFKAYFFDKFFNLTDQEIIKYVQIKRI